MILLTTKRSKIFFFACLSFILGVALASFFQEKILLHFEKILLLGIFFLFLCFLPVGKNRSLKVVILWATFLFLGILRLIVSLPEDSPERALYYHDQEVNIKARVSDRVEPGLENQQLELKVMELDQKQVSGKVLVTTELYPEYSYGDKLRVKGFLQEPPDFEDFAYSRYLAQSGIYSVIYYPDIEVLGQAELSLFQRVKKNIYSFKDRSVYILESGLDEPASSLAKAMVLGDRSTVSQDLRDDFSRSGISHITAISGMHIGILAALVFQILLSLGLQRNKILVASCLFLVFYIFMVGLPASAIRAGVMGGLVLLSFSLGRFHRVENLLVLAAAVMLFANPQLLRDSLGFQLSFLAVTGIWYFYPGLNEFFQRIHKERSMFKSASDVFIITVSAQALTLPLIAHNFSHISILAPLTNLLVLWTLPLILLFTLFGLSLGFVLPNFSWLWLTPVNILLDYVVIVGSYISDLSFSVIMVESSFWWWIIYYLLFLLFIFLYRQGFLLKFRSKDSKLNIDI